jgi:nicotinate-nucleotide adenylyltransferase
METSNLGIMGGTFNPIHLGHLMIAEEARQRFHLSQVLFIPAYLPPHKEVDGATAQQRLEMTRLAVADNPYFAVSDMEIRRGGRSYTADTIRLLKEQYGPERVLYFIAGTDTIQDLPNWHHPSYILESCQFIGASRPDGTEAIDNIIRYFGVLGTHIHKLEVPAMDLSSTDLRYRIRHGLSVRYLIPQSVCEYIEKNGVYQCV